MVRDHEIPNLERCPGGWAEDARCLWSTPFVAKAGLPGSGFYGTRRDIGDASVSHIGRSSRELGPPIKKAHMQLALPPKEFDPPGSPRLVELLGVSYSAPKQHQNAHPRKHH